MELSQSNQSEEDNLEIIFTLKLNKSFVKTVQEYPSFAENLMIIKNDTNKECVGSVAISNPVFDLPLMAKSKDGRSPKKRGRKRKNDEPAILKMVQQAKGPKKVQQSQHLQADSGLIGDNPEPLDLSKKEALDFKQNPSLSIDVNPNSNSTKTDMPLDLSLSPLVKEKSRTPSVSPVNAVENLSPNNSVKSDSVANSAREPLAPTEDPNCASISEHSTEDFTSEIFQMINGIPKMDAETVKPAAQGKKKGTKAVKSNGSAVPVKKSSEPKSYACDYCSLITSSKHILKRHEIAEHESARPFACTMCDHRCKQKTNLKLHLVHKHKMTGPDAAEMLKHTEFSKVVCEGSLGTNEDQGSSAAHSSPMSATFTVEETEIQGVSPASSLDFDKDEHQMVEMSLD